VWFVKWKVGVVCQVEGGCGSSSGGWVWFVKWEGGVVNEKGDVWLITVALGT